MNNNDFVRARVASLKPGQQVEIDRELLRSPKGLASYLIQESAADSVLEGILGSSYEFWYEENPSIGHTTFGRLKQPLEDGRRSYVSPDRRRHYRKEGRFYCPVSEQAVAGVTTKP